LDEIEKALSRLSKNTTGGYIDLSGREFLIRNIGTVKTEDDILNSVVGLHLGNPVLIKDIAEVKVGAQVKRGDGSVNGKPAVILSIQKQPGANTVELTKNIDTTSELCTLALTAIDMRPRPIEEAPKDGAAFLAFGIHDTDNGRHWRKGDEWTCILLYDTWREVGMGGGEFVFSKDGAKPWSKPLSFIPLTALPKVQS
jgi:hypothetical protein